MKQEEMEHGLVCEAWKTEVKLINSVLKSKEDSMKNINQTHANEMKQVKKERQNKMKRTKNKFHNESVLRAKAHRQQKKVRTNISTRLICFTFSS